MSRQTGQAMLLTVIALGGTLLGATTIAGLLMLYQIRQSTDLKDSNKAIFAADAGLEMAAYTTRYDGYFVTTTIPQEIVDQNGVSNGARISELRCYSATDTSPGNILDPCSFNTTTPPLVLRSYGEAGRANRALEQ